MTDDDPAFAVLTAAAHARPGPNQWRDVTNERYPHPCLTDRLLAMLIVEVRELRREVRAVSENTSYLEPNCTSCNDRGAAFGCRECGRRQR